MTSISLSIFALVLGVLVLLSRASEPSMVLAEQLRTQNAQATVRSLSTQNAYLAARAAPTKRPCTNAGPDFYHC